MPIASYCLKVNSKKPGTMNKFIFYTLLVSFTGALYSNVQGSMVESAWNVSASDQNAIAEPDVGEILDSEETIEEPERRKYGRASFKQ